MKGEHIGDGRVLRNLRMGRAEVRDDLLLDYLMSRLSPVVAQAVRQRAAMDQLVARRLEDLRAELLYFNSRLTTVPDESLPPEWTELLRRVGTDGGR